VREGVIAGDRRETLAAAHDLLFTEARLLDQNRLDEWLELFTDDAEYRIPAGSEDDPRTKVSIVFDDRGRLEERVWRLQSGLAHAQEPRSRTARLISNVQIDSTDGDSVIVVSNFIVVELRRGVETTFAGSYEHHLRRVEGGFRIAKKKVDLINKEEPIGNLSFIV
jgi:benzoate/toluate 1,2-dioxygenase beta subunit